MNHDGHGRVTVRAAIAPLHAAPRVSSEMISQRVAGQWLHVIAEDGDWIHGRGRDDYAGWVHRGYVTEFVPLSAAEATTARVSLDCMVIGDDGHARRLPLGARLQPADVVQHGEAIAAAHLAERFRADAATVVATAERFFSGTPYLWGGTTPWGADCSGLVQSTFALHGLILPRDTVQQAQAGTHVAHAPELLDAGDLLFFSDREDRRVTHVAIAAGDGRIVHCALGRGGFATERWDDVDDYMAGLRRRYLFARRVSLPAT